MALDSGPGGGVGDGSSTSSTDNDTGSDDDNLESSQVGGVSAGPGSDAPVSDPQEDTQDTDSSDSERDTDGVAREPGSAGGGVAAGPDSGDSPVQPQEDTTTDQMAGDGTTEAESTQAQQLENQLSEGAQQADVEQVSDGAFRVETDATAGSGPSPGPSSSRTRFVATSDEGLRTLRSMQARRRAYAGVAQQTATLAAENEAIERTQTAQRRASEAQGDFERGNLGDTRDIIAESVAEEAGEDVSPEDVRVRNVGGDARVEIRGQPRERIVSGLEEQIAEDGPDVELSQSDVDFETTQQDGETQIRGELTEDAQKRVRQESAPGQGTPLEGVFETGAGLQFEYEQRTEGVERTFNRVTPDTPSSDDLFGLATAAAPVAAAEPTPAGEAVVGGILVVGTAAAAAEGLSRVSQASGVTATTVDVPDDTSGQFQDELEISGNANQFVSELGIPDRQEQMAGPFGVPEQGITIDPEGNVAPWETNPEEVPVEGGEVFTSEVQIPDDSASDADVLQTQPQQALERAQRRGRQEGRRESSSGVGSERSTSREVPERFIPDEEVTIGDTGGESLGGGFPSVPAREGPGLVIGSGSGVGFIGREARPERTLTRGEDAFLAIDLAEPFDSTSVRESAEQASVGGDAQATTVAAGTDPLTGTTTTTRADAGTDTRADTESGIDIGTATRTGTRVRSAQTTAATNTSGIGVTESASEAAASEIATTEATADEYLFEQGGSETRNVRTPPRPPIPELSSRNTDEEEEVALQTGAAAIRTDFVNPLTGSRDGGESSDNRSGFLGLFG